MNEAKNIKNTDPEMDKYVDALAKDIARYLSDNLGEDFLRDFAKGIIESEKKGNEYGSGVNE